MLSKEQLNTMTAQQITEVLKKAIDVGGPELDQCLLDLGLLKLEGNKIVRTARGQRALNQLNTLMNK